MFDSDRIPPGAGPAALATLLVVDAFVLPRLPVRPISGIVDEAAHAATGVALLAAPRSARRWRVRTTGSFAGWQPGRFSSTSTMCRSCGMRAGSALAGYGRCHIP